jgi:diguanylate cyclase (GGDEF)-like protein
MEKIREEKNKIMRWTIWRVCLISAIVVAVLEWLYYLAYDLNALRSLSRLMYIYQYICIPFAINATVLLGSFLVLKFEKLSPKGRNWFISITMYVVLSTIAIIHYVYFPVILITVAAIVTTAIFGDEDISIFITLASLVTAVVCFARFYGKGVLTDFYFVGYIIVTVIIIIFMGVVTGILNNHTNSMFESIANANVEQENLKNALLVEPMTGLFNRKAFKERIEMTIETVSETDDKAYLAIFDIDHFKNVNDTYGHGNGDTVLKALASILKKKSKDTGTAFRYGGEEFVIIFHNGDFEKVKSVVEDIRTSFRCYRFSFMNSDGITVSCGLAEFKPGESSEAWFNRADTALYQAKETGRNKTVVCE